MTTPCPLCRHLSSTQAAARARFLILPPGKGPWTRCRRCGSLRQASWGGISTGLGKPERGQEVAG